MNRPEEIKALGELAGDALEETVRIVEDVHGAVSDRVDSFLPPPAKPISAIVRASTAATYKSVRAAHKWIPRGAAAVRAATTAPDAPSLLASDAARGAVAAVNGIWGAAVTDRLGATTELTLYRHGEVVSSDLFASEFGDARPHLVLFVHGLAETEADWERQPRNATERRTPYAEQLEAEADVTPLAITYATGAAVGENGAALADLLDRIDTAWPGLTSITLVGHSMGGLVARSAAHHGAEAGQGWVSRLRLIITLGTPHLGAPLSQVVDLTERALTAFPESAPIARVLAGRSQGSRDLSDGRILVGDTAELDPPNVPGVTHCSVASTLTADPQHPVAVLLGDGLVLVPSATGKSRKRRLNFEVDTHLGSMSHVALLNDPAVYELIRGWIGEYALT